MHEREIVPLKECDHVIVLAASGPISNKYMGDMGDLNGLGFVGLLLTLLD